MRPATLPSLPLLQADDPSVAGQVRALAVRDDARVLALREAPEQLPAPRVEAVRALAEAREVDDPADHDRRARDLVVRLEAPDHVARGGVEAVEVLVEGADVDTLLPDRGR